MNSRSVSDNLVNFSTDLATTLNQLDSKEPLLSFPFDHLYACSESGDRRQTLHLKEVEISTHCVDPHQQEKNEQKVASLERENKKLKDLLIYHLDLIQQQNELMSKKDKSLQALQQENDTLKSQVTKATLERHVVFEHHGLTPQGQRAPVTSTITSAYKTDEALSQNQNFFNTLNEFLNSNDSSAQNSYLYAPGSAPKPLLEPFGFDRSSETDLHTFWTDLNVPSFLDLGALPGEDLAPALAPTSAPASAPAPAPAPTVTMIDNKLTRKEPKTGLSSVEPSLSSVGSTESRQQKFYTVTNTHGGTAKISRNRTRATGIGSFSRMPKKKLTSISTIYDNVIVQDEPKYGKSKPPKYGYTALQDKMQLIDPTPTGEDPYQIGEAEMREQSPIPKLMLQKTNHGRMRACADLFSGVTSTITSTTASRRIYDTISKTSTTSTSSRSKRTKPPTEDPYKDSNMHVQSKRDTANADLEEEQELDVEKTDSDIDWRTFTTNKPKKTSLCDFSYGESSANLVNIPLDITKMDFPDFFEPGPVNADSSNLDEDTTPSQPVVEKSKKQGARTTSLAGPSDEEPRAETNRTAETKRGRKRAHSTAAALKRGDNTQQKGPAKPRPRRANRPKKTPVPGMTTTKLYHTSTGNPEDAWYLMNPEIKKEDCDSTDNTSSNVEVPQWREKLFEGVHSVEGTENLDDKVFEKRHQKPEAEERRQLRWHMRRVREQRHVERLRQRQRDPWGSTSVQVHPPAEYTVWPQPVRDLQYIEITNTIPVTAFGVDVPDLPEKNFIPPWVRMSQALKRSKRSKTLH